MGLSAIEWTDYVFNPWIGCSKVSPGCANCYAEALQDKWLHRAKWGPNGTRVVPGDGYWQHPHDWNLKAKAEGVRRRVFCASQSDFFEAREELIEPRARALDLMRDTPWLDWLVLTKRPANAHTPYNLQHGFGDNVWLGVSVEDQERAEERIPELLCIPATVHFLSCEPLLGPIDLVGRLMSSDGFAYREGSGPIHRDDGGVGIDWVIVGGESGRNARVCNLKDILFIIKRCQDVGCPVFVKQLGSKPYVDNNHPECNVKLHAGHSPEELATFAEGFGEYLEHVYTLNLTHKKGGDWNEWPEQFRVREFPR